MAANRAKPFWSLIVATVTWISSALILQSLSLNALAGSLLFITSTCMALVVGAAYVQKLSNVKRKTGLGLLLIRGVLAGVLVALVTTTASSLGAAGAGILIAFPVGYTVVAITIHQNLGVATVISTLHSALLGTASLAGFCVTLSLTISHWPANIAFGSALATFVLITVSIIFKQSILAVFTFYKGKH